MAKCTGGQKYQWPNMKVAKCKWPNVGHLKILDWPQTIKTLDTPLIKRKDYKNLKLLTNIIQVQSPLAEYVV